jgi:hypothetical protein
MIILVRFTRFEHRLDQKVTGRGFNPCGGIRLWDQSSNQGADPCFKRDILKTLRSAYEVIHGLEIPRFRKHHQVVVRQQ